jgi:hypothetical protein
VEKKHATFSASGSERWLNCPGSIALSEIAPPQVDSRYALEGTDAHTVLETILKSKKPAATIRMLKKRYPDSMVEHGVDCASYLWSTANGPVFSETRVKLDFVSAGMFGTVDAWFVTGNILNVFDYKYGAGRLVQPENNTQMIYYALGLAYGQNFNFETARLIIGQPRIAHKEGIYRSWDISMKDLKRSAFMFKNGVEACKDFFAPLVPGRWCYFCPANKFCPKLESDKYYDAKDVFND